MSKQRPFLKNGKHQYLKRRMENTVLGRNKPKIHKECYIVLDIQIYKQ